MDGSFLDTTLGTKAEIIVLSADIIEAESKDGAFTGMSICYTFNTTFDNVYTLPKRIGQKPGKAWMSYEQFYKIVSAPAKYLGTFGMRIGSDGKPILILKDLDYICDVRLIEVTPACPEHSLDNLRYSPVPKHIPTLAQD